MRILIFFSLWLVAFPAHAAAVFTITWMSAPLPCDEWSSPIVSKNNRPLCAIGAYTICPTPSVGNNPYDRGQPILITGYQLTQILSDPTACGYAVLGSAHGNPQDGADTFASGSGCGNWTRSHEFGSGDGVPQGGGKDAHIDAYAACSKGTYRLLAVIEYIRRR